MGKLIGILLLIIGIIITFIFPGLFVIVAFVIVANDPKYEINWNNMMPFFITWIMGMILIVIGIILIIKAKKQSERIKHQRELQEQIEKEERKRLRRERLEQEMKEREILERKERERMEAERIEAERKEKEAIVKLRKIMSVSERISLSMMRDVLELDEKAFNQRIIDWAAEFDFTIDGEYLNVNKETVDNFIDALDRQFTLWEKKEADREGKI